MVKETDLKPEAIGLIISLLLITWVPADVAAGDGDAESATNVFTRVTEGPQVNDGGWSFGVSWIDYDGDTYPDLFVCNDDFGLTTDVNYLYHNNGNGTYTRISNGDIAAGGSCIASTWADYDGDGDLDCFAVRPFLNNNLLYINNGDGTFKGDTSSLLVAARKFSMEVEWVDFDDDGWLDVFVANHGRPNDPAMAMFYHNENGVFTLLSNSDVGLIEDEANGAAWGDCDGDGNRDLFWTRNNKPSLLFANSGEGVFTRMSENALAQPPAKYFGNWADFDNDGDLDIYTKSGDPGVVTLYKNTGSGDFVLVADQKLAEDTGSWTGGYWGDYDNDGWLDLLVLGNNRYESHPNRLYRNNGDGSFTRVTGGPVASAVEPSAAAAWADHDRDGDLDLFIANVNNFNNALYENPGNANHWIQVKLEGKSTNRSGIGAKIRIKAVLSGEPVWQMREISAKTGFKSQSELVAHFGLGSATVVDSLIVEWPAGGVQILTGVDVDQYLTITEADTSE
ncbi:MAG: CRTAC1 family protein [Candidatus Zixiibacteriota bacterium]|nr:MAG: CRTAC1 family protein [candidate division Zixibacteria bacterium]